MLDNLEGQAWLSPKQIISILNADGRVNIWEGSVSSGKTFASIIAWLDYVANHAPKRGRLVMIGRTRDTLYRNVLTVIEEILPPGSGEFSYTKGTDRAKLFGREIEILGANDVSAESRIRGMTCAGFYVDEWTLLPGDGYWQQLLNRLRVPGARGFVTTNPDGPNHWAKLVLDQAGELGYRTWHFLLEDNPVLEDEYVESVKRENTGVWFQRNILGLWVLAEGAIWPMFDEEAHVYSEDPDRYLGLEVAIDDATASVYNAVLLGLTDDAVHVVREFRWDAKAKQVQLTDKQKVEKTIAWLKSVELGTDGNLAVDGALNARRIHVDPAATSLIRQYDIDRYPVAKASNDVRDGLQYVATLFGMGRLKVHTSCVELLKEIPGYVWDPKAAKNGEDKPLKQNDHSCDSMRYGVMGTSRWWWPWLKTKVKAPTE
jgi:PBSX family phage terminase large subunit